MNGNTDDPLNILKIKARRLRSDKLIDSNSLLEICLIMMDLGYGEEFSRYLFDITGSGLIVRFEYGNYTHKDVEKLYIRNDAQRPELFGRIGTYCFKTITLEEYDKNPEMITIFIEYILGSRLYVVFEHLSDVILYK